MKIILVCPDNGREIPISFSEEAIKSYRSKEGFTSAQVEKFKWTNIDGETLRDKFGELYDAVVVKKRRKDSNIPETD